MRLLRVIALLIPVCAASQAQAQPLGPACIKPDQRLIAAQGNVSRFSDKGASEKYSAQVAAFNACTQSRLDNAGKESARVADENKALRGQVAQNASSRIRRIEGQINDTGQALVAGAAPPKSANPPVDAFPDADCKPADAGLLTLKRGADNRGRERQYAEQGKDYQSCMRGWIDQAKSAIAQIKSDAEAEMKNLTEGANRKIADIAAASRDAARQAETAQQEQDAAVANLRTTLAATATPAAATEMAPSLPHSQDMPTGAGDPDAITCRSRQQLADSRLMGPQICKRNRVWAELYKAGKTISADGLSIVGSEKDMTMGTVLDKR